MLDFARINAAALANAEAVVRRIVPGGTLRGREYVALNPKRSDKRPGSFKINTRTGRWADFATGERGRDLISFIAWRYDVRQIEAARQLAVFLRVEAEVRR